MNKRSLRGLVSDVALGTIRMPLTSAESSSGRMAPQLLKPHQAIAVLLKIKSWCLGGGGGEQRKVGGEERSKNGEAVALAELFFLLCISCVLTKQAHGCSCACMHTQLLTRPQWVPQPELGGGGGARGGRSGEDGREKEFNLVNISEFR